MKKPKPKTNNATRQAAEAWPLLAAYLDLAERHAALLTERLEAALARAREAKEKQIEADVAAIMANVQAAIMAAPAPAIFKQ